MTFSEKFKIIRKHIGKTQAELAADLGVSRQAVQKWESGDSFPDINKLPQISEVLNISIDDLLDQHLSEDELKKMLLGIEPEEDIFSIAKKATKTDWIIFLTILAGTGLLVALLHIIGVLLLVLFFGITTGTSLTGVYSFINAFYNVSNGLGTILVNFGISFITIPLSVLMYNILVDVVKNYVKFTKDVIKRLEKQINIRGVKVHAK